MQEHLGASEAKGVESVMRDLGCAVKPAVVIHAKATEQNSPSTWNWHTETRRRGALVSAR